MLLGAVLALLVATDLFNPYVWFELLLMATLGMLLLALLLFLAFAPLPRGGLYEKSQHLAFCHTCTTGVDTRPCAHADDETQRLAFGHERALTDEATLLTEAREEDEQIGLRKGLQGARKEATQETDRNLISRRVRLRIKPRWRQTLAISTRGQDPKDCISSNPPGFGYSPPPFPLDGPWPAKRSASADHKVGIQFTKQMAIAEVDLTKGQVPDSPDLAPSKNKPALKQPDAAVRG